MTERQRGLLRLIEEAFRGVELGDGVSLHETVVLDDYGGPEERRAARQLDEKHDWRKLIGNPELIRPTSMDRQTAGLGGLSFYDAAGLRFHLPPYLSLVVTDPATEDAQTVAADLLFHLSSSSMSDYNQERFTLLSAAQRTCVREAEVSAGPVRLPRQWTTSGGTRSGA